MTVSFNHIPSTLRLPLFYAEVDNSQANSATAEQKTLIVGQITSDGSGVANVPVFGSGSGNAKTLGGPGSMLHLMTVAYVASDAAGEIWFLPLADAEDSIAATGAIEVTSAPTDAGVISLYVAGTLLSISVTATDTAVTVAEDIAAKITAAVSLPVTAVVDSTNTSNVIITAKNTGTGGNDIDLRLNYLGTSGGEVTPTGLALTITAMAGGATNPTLDDALANLGDETFDFIVSPYTDTTSLNALKSLLNDTDGRWSWANQVYGHVFSVKEGTLSALTTFGTARNNQHESVLGMYGSPTPSWVVAADFGGAAAVALRNDPGRPLQTLTLSSTLAPVHDLRFTMTERNGLLWAGISTFTVASDGTVALENVITTYQTNSYGEADNSYLEVETLFLLMYVLRSMKTLVTSKFPRMKLGADGGTYSAGSNVVTPSTIKSALVAHYQEMEADGYVQDSTTFASGLVVEQDSTNVNRVNILWPGTLINQLRVMALLAQFRL